MAHFRGILQGSRGRASRLGTKNSGLFVEAASWEGKVEVTLIHRIPATCARCGYDQAGHRGDQHNFIPQAEYDEAEVWLASHHGAGTYRLLYRGPVGGVPDATDPTHSG